MAYSEVEDPILAADLYVSCIDHLIKYFNPQESSTLTRIRGLARRAMKGTNNSYYKFKERSKNISKRLVKDLELITLKLSRNDKEEWDLLKDSLDSIEPEPVYVKSRFNQIYETFLSSS